MLYAETTVAHAAFTRATVSEPLASHLQTRKWLIETPVVLTSQTLALHACTFQQSILRLTMDTAVARVSALIRLCYSSIPATKKCPSH